jgi:hypothetical protein
MICAHQTIGANAGGASRLQILVFLLILVVAICIFIPSESRVDRRTWLTISKVSLKSADADLHKFGILTNRFQNVTVNPYTNHFTVDGVDYQCELAATCERLTNRGFLAITTNQIFVWIDTKGSLTVLTNHVRSLGF